MILSHDAVVKISYLLVKRLLHFRLLHALEKLLHFALNTLLHFALALHFAAIITFFGVTVLSRSLSRIKTGTRRIIRQDKNYEL